jgi:hypothetical protein
VKARRFTFRGLEVSAKAVRIGSFKVWLVRWPDGRRCVIAAPIFERKAKPV